MPDNNFQNNAEFNALVELEGVDVNEIKKQVGMEVEETPDNNQPAPKEDAQVDEKKDPQTPPTPEPTKDTKKEDIQADAPNAADQQNDLLKEIFGDRFKTVDEAKNANISGMFDELETLRQGKAELEQKLSKKPKTNFANDKVALFNEFVKQTGVMSQNIFDRVNSSDFESMDPIDALVAQHLLKNPGLANKEASVRRFFERKYQVNPDEVEGDELESNRVGLEIDAQEAKKELMEIKSNLKIPEPEPEADPQKPKELSPEEKKALDAGWKDYGAKASQALSKLKIPIKGSEDPLLDFEISESEQQEISAFIHNYAVQNQMELNENTAKMIGSMVYSNLIQRHLPDIVHAAGEKVRSMTEEQVHSFYDNPSPSKNNDTPPEVPEDVDPYEKKVDNAFEAEMGRG
jgi:hypothetical protein